MNELRKEVETLRRLGYEDEAWDILMEHKFFDIDISCSAKTLEGYVGDWRFIGFEDETHILKDLGEKLKRFCKWARENNVKIEYRVSAADGHKYELFECDYSCSDKRFIEIWDKEFEKWRVDRGVIIIKSLDELEGFAEKLINLYS